MAWWVAQLLLPLVLLLWVLRLVLFAALHSRELSNSREMWPNL
jgi:hypothetical protein